MKISKSLLQKIAVGILVTGYGIVCEVEEPYESRHDENCIKNCKLKHAKSTRALNFITPDYQCYACGRG